MGFGPETSPQSAGSPELLVKRIVRHGALRNGCQATKVLAFSRSKFDLP